jgi:hypothetical protein
LATFRLNWANSRAGKKRFVRNSSGIAMAARILHLAQRADRATSQPLASPCFDNAIRCHFWRGASGERYLHTVYTLIECPILPRAVYMLVRRHADGHRTVLHIGIADNDAPTLNLARVRQRGATLGASEVHVYSLAEDDERRSLIAGDLRAAQFAELGAEPSPRLRA